MIYQIKILLFACYILSAFCAPINCKDKPLKIEDFQKDQVVKPSNHEDLSNEHNEIQNNNENILNECNECNENNEMQFNNNLSVSEIISMQMNTLLLKEDTNQDCMVTIKKLRELKRVMFNEGTNVGISDTKNTDNENIKLNIENLMDLFNSTIIFKINYLTDILESFKNIDGYIPVDKVHQAFTMSKLNKNIVDIILKRLTKQNGCVKYDDLIKHLK
ncbi:FNIP repeat-containing protein DDB_G0290617-like [Daktulosphaira vitifoliae]|uniref:FNIP repeat-containing protein DDB_G0290617-like n=1 Tax=Daktulosphaira vitifoliae TaxID=58002 RepID=UPI0021A9CBD3|nr:FNIP repeat-containing protein DDB_G0290617-like [Daktulosphaira vitifoliae]